MVLGMLLQGAFWPKLRRQGAQADVAQAVCPRCHDFIEDSCHLFWGCPCNPEVDIELLTMAEEGFASCPSFWGRGMVPLCWTSELLSPYPALDKMWCGGLLLQAPLALTSNMVVATDGSGVGKDARMFRIGFGGVILH
eukprot:6939226-Prorocentrum_lima.AAC.1